MLIPRGISILIISSIKDLVNGIVKRACKGDANGTMKGIVSGLLETIGHSPPSSNSHQTSMVPLPCFFLNCWLVSSSRWSLRLRGDLMSGEHMVALDLLPPNTRRTHNGFRTSTSKHH